MTGTDLKFSSTGHYELYTSYIQDSQHIFEVGCSSLKS